MTAVASRDKIRKCCAILGVPEDADMKQIKSVYHARAARLHPDRRPNDPVAAEAFKKINVAYQLLRKHHRKTAMRPAPEDEPAEKPAAPPPGKAAPGRETPTTQRPAPGQPEHRTPEYKPPGTGLGMAPGPSTTRKPSPGAAPTCTVEELVLRLKHSQNQYLRVHAARALREEGGREAVWALLPALQDPSAVVVAEAAAALGALRARIATLPLINLHRKSTGALRERIEGALRKIGSPMAAQYLSGASGSPEQDTDTTPASASRYA